MALLTGAVAVGGDASPYAAVVYVAAVALALFVPAAITAQVIGGQMLAGLLLMGGGPIAWVGAALIVAGVVATAELLAEVARLDTPLRRDPVGALPRATMAAAVGGTMVAAVLLAHGLPELTGLAAVALASAVCFGLAMRMVKGRT